MQERLPPARSPPRNERKKWQCDRHAQGQQRNWIDGNLESRRVVVGELDEYRFGRKRNRRNEDERDAGQVSFGVAVQRVARKLFLIGIPHISC